MPFKFCASRTSHQVLEKCWFLAVLASLAQSYSLLKFRHLCEGGRSVELSLNRSEAGVLVAFDSQLESLRGQNCSVAISAPNGTSIVASVHRLLAPHSCASRLQLSSDDTSALFCKALLPFPGGESTSLVFSGGRLTLTMAEDRPSDGRLFAFTLAFTALAHAPCGSDAYACANGLCAWDGFFCDGYNNCGDGSDETGRPSRPCDNAPAGVPTVVRDLTYLAALLAVVLVALAVVVCAGAAGRLAKKRRREREKRNARERLSASI